MNTQAIRALVRNDLRLYLTDRRALIVGVLVPILIAAFFGYVFGRNGNSDNGKIPIALVDQDHSEITRAIVADFSNDSLVATQTLERSVAEDRVRAGKVQVAAVLPKNFGADAVAALTGNQTKPNIELLVDPSQGLSGRVVEGLLAQHGMQEIAKQAARMAGSQGGTPPALRLPYSVVTANVTSPQQIPYNGYAHSFAGMTTQFILLAGIDAGVVLLLMRDRGVWQRLRSAPLSRTDFIVARTTATTLISLFQFALVYLAAILIFGVRIEGSVVGFAGIAVALCFLNAAFGLMLAALGGSAGATRGIAAMVTLLLVMVGGAWVPSFVFPKWLQEASLLAPTRWAVDGLDGATWRGQPLSAALAPFAVLMGTALVCLGIAIWRFRWEEK
jgi:ABC-2 type transport system permease protein